MKTRDETFMKQGTLRIRRLFGGDLITSRRVPAKRCFFGV